MGTNYYMKRSTGAGRPVDSFEGTELENTPLLHIGKASAGWRFALHVYPERRIRDLRDWTKLWDEPGTKIYNEYGGEVSASDLIRIIVSRAGERRRPLDDFCVDRGLVADYVQGDFS